MNFVIFLLILFLTVWVFILSSMVEGLREKVKLLEVETESLYKLIWKSWDISISPSMSKSCSVSSSEPPSPSWEAPDDPEDDVKVCPYCKSTNDKESLKCIFCGGVIK